MYVFIFVLIAIIVAGVTCAKKNEFYADYLAPRNTATINAVFSILIFLSHATQYYTLNGVFDKPYLNLRSWLGQMVVVTYLFFSGYGMMESIKKKGPAYIRSIPYHRFFKLWYKFALILLLFLGIRFYTGNPPTLKNALLAFTGYTSLGNSNWYMLVTFALYIVIFMAFLLFRKRGWLGVATVFILTAAFALLLRHLKCPQYYYDTIFCLPVGMLFSLVKSPVDKLLMKNDLFWFAAFALISAFTFYFGDRKGRSIIFYSCFSVCFVLLIVVLMMKVNLKSSILDWFGEHIFSFFMLQRIPMILLKHWHFTKSPYVFIICCFVATVVLATFFDALTAQLDRLLFQRKDTKKLIAK